MQRLFKEFCSSLDPEKIDYRHFVRVLASVTDEPTEDKVALLFELWDIDRSGTLSYSELSPIVTASIQTHEMEEVLEDFNLIWGDIRSGTTGNDGGEWIGLSRATGVTKDDLCDACVKNTNVREFFSSILTRQPPKADTRSQRNFHARLRELQAEVAKESRQLDQEQALSSEASREQMQGRRAPARRGSNFVLGDSVSAPSLTMGVAAAAKHAARHLSPVPARNLLGSSQKDLMANYKIKASGALVRPSVAVMNIKLPPLGNKPRRVSRDT
jgi:hypothetical protein